MKGLDEFPYNERTTAFILVDSNGNVEQPVGREMLRAAVKAVEGQNARLFAVWPGRWRSDLFEVDDLQAMRRSLR